MMTVFPVVPGVRQQQHLTTFLRRAGPLVLLPGPMRPRAIPQTLENARGGQGVLPIVAHHEPLGRRTPPTVDASHAGRQAPSFGTG